MIQKPYVGRSFSPWMCGFFFFNFAMRQSVLLHKRWSVCQNARQKENPKQNDLTRKGGTPQRYLPVIPSPAALSPDGWAARCECWIAHLYRGPQAKRSTCDLRRLSPERGVATLRRSDALYRPPASCLTEVGEDARCNRKLRAYPKSLKG